MYTERERERERVKVSHTSLAVPERPIDLMLASVGCSRKKGGKEEGRRDDQRV